MKLFLAKPTERKILELIHKFECNQCSHQNVGSTEYWPANSFKVLPDSKVVDGDLWQYRRVTIGMGEADYTAAVVSVRTGICFDVGWAKQHQLREFHEGDVFSLVTKAFSLWTANFCQIIYVRVDETDEQKLFLMGIGTLPCHAATGEERMSILWRKDTNVVDFLIGSFSQPSTLLSRIFVSFLRRQQDRFAEDSANRQRESVAAQGNRKD